MGTQFIGKVKEASAVYVGGCACVNVVFDLDESDSSVVFLIPEDVFIELDSMMKLFKSRKAGDIRTEISKLKHESGELEKRIFDLKEQASDLEE